MEFIKTIVDTLGKDEVVNISIRKTDKGEAFVVVDKADATLTPPVAIKGGTAEVEASVLGMFGKAERVEVEVKNAPAAGPEEAPVQEPQPAPAVSHNVKESKTEPDKEKANELYKQGTAAYKKGDFKAAFDFFQQSREYATPQQVEVIDKSLARCREHVGEDLFK